MGTVRTGDVACAARLVHGGRSTQVWDAEMTDSGHRQAPGPVPLHADDPVRQGLTELPEVKNDTTSLRAADPLDPHSLAAGGAGGRLRAHTFRVQPGDPRRAFPRPPRRETTLTWKTGASPCPSLELSFSTSWSSTGKARLEPPIGSTERAAYLQWLHFAEGTAASPINTTVWLTVYRQDADRHTEIIEAVRGSANTVFGPCGGRAWSTGPTWPATR